MKITELSINRPSLVVVLFTILVGAGLFTYRFLGYELIPEVAPPTMTVITIYPGASPDEVESNVTEKIEQALSKLNGVKKITANSYENFSVISIELFFGENLDQAIQKTASYINSVKGQMPRGISEPQIEKRGVADLPVIYGGVASSLSKTDFYDLLDKKLKPRLQSVSGVAKLKFVGGQKREIQINIDKDKLTTYGISLQQITQILQYSNMEIPAGKVKNKGTQSTIRVRGKFNEVEDIRELIVVDNPAQGFKIKLSDIAEVVDGKQEEKIISRIDGIEAVGFQILKQSGANAVEMSAKVHQVMRQLENEFNNANLQFTTFTDTTDYTIQAAEAVTHDLEIAILLVSVVMLLFLHSFRNAVITMIAVPTSLVATFTVVYLLGYTLNLMTLLGLSLVVGILVDDAIIVIENIHSHMEKGKTAAQAALDAIREIALTVSSITLVIIVVFLPLGMTGGMVGLLFQQFSVVVAFSTLMSLLVAFTLVPLLMAKFSKHETVNPNSFFGKLILGFEKIIDRMIDAFTNGLKWALRHKAVTLLATLVMFFGSFALLTMGYIGSEAFASGDRGDFTIQIELPKSVTPKATNELTQEVETYVGSLPEVEQLNVVVGTKETDEEGQGTPYFSYINVKLSDKRKLSTALYAHQIRLELEKRIPNASFTTATLDDMGSSNPYKVELIVQGNETDKLIEYAESIRTSIESIPGIIRTKLSLEKGAKELNINIDRAKLATLDLTVGEVGMQMRTAFEGDNQSKLKVGNREYDILVRLDNFDRQSIADIENLPFTNASGQVFKLSQFAAVSEEAGLTQLDRYNRLPSVTVKVQVSGRPTGTVGEEMKTVIDGLDKPDGVKLHYGGDLEMQAESFGRLGTAFMISIVLVYLIMIALYDSYITPLVVLFSIPLAIIGALWALALTQQNLSIFTILGIIMLIGLVAKNAIMLVDFANTALKEGKEIVEALVFATQARFRPIFMTTIAMVVGMLPIATATGAGSSWKNGLAWALIGGLSSSMVLTLIVIPVIFYLSYQMRTWMNNKFKKKEKAKAEITVHS
ncbi:MAG: efflux RND transporter permease subunit [Cytophagales bacterium]|nr:efflux RND transporter permease subunit [Cytophagales bacterium]